MVITIITSLTPKVCNKRSLKANANFTIKISIKLQYNYFNAISSENRKINHLNELFNFL